MLINTLYAPPSDLIIAEAKAENKYYKAIYNNGKLSHYLLQTIKEVKNCGCHGQRNTQ